ncbi:hypothetical protein Clacol_005201 [Clathrus columnatus]|uniref:Uncharacterized protein n=1 Tax=Clathrus columnatus TaxID=1419009 RepID=A0AAV5AB93_9AGAM|nr:hypothetical protein Clacol_005201 [Clathrus columnatus]
MKEASKKTYLPTLEKFAPLPDPEPQLVFGPSRASDPSSFDYMTGLSAIINELAKRSIQE